MGVQTLKRMLLFGIVSSVFLCGGGCGGVTWRSYHGPQDWATGAGLSSETKDGIFVFEGLPPRSYEVLGIVEAQDPANFLVRPGHRKKMHALIREHGGNGMIIVGREIIRTGSSGSYQTHAYSGGNMSHGTSSWSDEYNYALAVLAIRLSTGDTALVEREGRDPAAWARSVLAGGTALLGSETDK